MKIGKPKIPPELKHEPALKEDGSTYQPWMFDDTGEIQGYQALLCRHCHAFYANPNADPIVDRALLRQGVREDDAKVPWSAKIEGDVGGCCPARVYALIQATLL